MKRHTAKELLRPIKESSQENRREWMRWLFARAGQRNARNTRQHFWQQSNHPVELPTNELRQQRLAYLHRNPVVASFVDTLENFPYSSARGYAGCPGLLELPLST